MSTTATLFSCSKCNLTFSGKKTLRKHKQERHPPTFPCTKCSLTFSEEMALRKHRLEAHPPTFPCAKCNLTFSGEKMLRNHKQEVHPPSFYCPKCNLPFATRKARQEHKRKVHPRCKICKKRHLGLGELRNHQRETGHLYCRECDVYFSNSDSHTAHVRAIQHTTEHHCCDCDREYVGQEALNNHCCDCDKVCRTEIGLQKHFASPTHIRNAAAAAAGSLDSSFPPRCEACNQEFSSEKNLRKHMLNHKHLRNIPCPVGGNCIKKFATPSALLNHLESGSCKSGMTRVKMAGLVFAHDSNRYITSIDGCTPVEESASTSRIQNPTNPDATPRYNLRPRHSTPIPLEFDEDDTASEWSVMNGVPLTPTTSEGATEWSLVSGGILTPDASDELSEWSFTGGVLVATPSHSSMSNINRAGSISELALPHTLHCHLCPPNGKSFGSIRAFQAHVASPAHAPKIFHCPLSFLPNVKPEDLLKRRTFSTLGGLTQHLESGGCSGGIELYKKAIMFVEEQLEALGLSGVRLLSP